MDIDQTTVSAPEERGAGGELRKLSASPYACPTESVRRRWISKLVDPAYRLIAGRATRILPSFLSPAPPLSALPSPTSDVEDQDRWRTGDSLEDYSRRSNIHLLASKSTEMASTSGISGKLKSSSDLVLSRQDEKGEQSDKSRLSDIEGLVKGKKFSRDEFDHLVKVLNSRAMDLSYVERGKENANLISRKDDSGLAMAHVLPTVSDEQRQEVLTGTIRGSPSPFGLPKVQDEIGASIEIARAYMDSLASGAGPSSKSMIHTVKNSVLHGDEAAIKPYDPSPSKKSSTCWPGAVVPEAYVTPQSQRSRFGLHNFPRTPYSRTLLTKSKSKFIHTQGGNSNVSSTPCHQSQTTLYLQDKSKVGASESGYGSVGPIRRIRHKVGTQSSSRRPAYSSGVVERFTSIAKSMDPDATSCIHKPLSFEVGVPLPTAHMHTSLMAKKILDHIDRNIPTPKEKSAELKMAMKWKNPESSTDFSTILSDEDNGLVKLKDVSPYKYDGIYGKKSTLRNDVKGNYHVDMQPKESTQKSMNVRKEGTLTSDINVCSSIPSLSNVASTTQNFDGSQNLLTSSKEDALKTLPCGSHPCVVNQERKPLTNSAASKPVLPPISIKKPKSRWTLESDNGSGFTFPISTSSSVFSEPPTPSIMPLLSTGDQRQLKERSTEPPYSFGLKKSSPAVVFSFPSTSNTAVQNDAGDIKFNFGSTENPRLSFSFGKNAVCC
ncbi:nuclear pore complex protein NUP1 isoform X2 [Abrus precatorius]|uniref:Nuclear pore complex protein NUP1 isoform X2 n=1 Tax=Abrus precatorius TaxID=3816 RepID=A0A8B8JIL8_ABRPR|nr:nuclear pore complex protein NUP1 isoform X2 [Abrus precatorius]